ncbi:MAG: DEAD/DEAH box helicase family protein [Pseudomonadota bacterium]
MSQFTFLATDFTPIHDLAKCAETAALSDPRGACFNARLALETALKWLYRAEPALRSPYDDKLAALIHEPSLERLVGPALVAKAKYIKDQGNFAVHNPRPVSTKASTRAVRELFHVTYWLARTYAKSARPPDGLRFDPAKLEKTITISASTVEQIARLREKADADAKAFKDAANARLASEEGRNALETELAALRAEMAALRRANQAVPDTHDYDEATTRDAFIDLLLNEAGWTLDQQRDTEFPVTGMPNDTGEGFVDYVLWGDDGRPLALVEAKRMKKDPRIGQQQAKLYADCLEAAFGRRPVIYYTNGYEHWFWDDVDYPPRPVHGFMKKDELELLHQRRTNRRRLAEVDIDGTIAGRFYQARAIRRIGETFEKDARRKALIVMATGAGKTRTVVALVDQLMRANWVRRVLFLADRRALVRQAHGVFKAQLPSAPSANLLEKHDPKKNDHSGARVLLSTYPTMMNLIEEMRGGERRFGPGHFDLVIVDEAHRSVYRKYRALFDYFDSMLVGLTATPRDEIDRDTYSLFQLERGVPTDAFDLDEAVERGFLVPPECISVPLKFQREGIRYADLTDDEKAEWDALEWDEDGIVPEAVGANDINKWLFNIDTVDKVLEHLMTHGIKVAGGDRLGKTIIFAKNSPHAHFIGQRLFTTRVEIVGAIDTARSSSEAGTERNTNLRASITQRLHDEVAGMSFDNFIVRPKRRSVEKFKEPGAWDTLTEIDRQELVDEVAGLPTAFMDDDFAAKQFDLLVLRTQLAILKGDASSVAAGQKAIIGIAAELERLVNVPLVKRQMEIIEEVQTDPYWEDITAPMLETVRVRLRELVKLIEAKSRKPVFTDFEDQIGEGTEAEVDMPSGTDMASFRRKVRRFVEGHQDHLAFQKVRRAQRLTSQDVAELERMFVAEGVADEERLAAIRAEGGIGGVLRSLLGLDREAARQAFNSVLDPTVMTANQIEFIDLIIDYLTERGTIDPALLYESPFTDTNDQGLGGVFRMEQQSAVISLIRELNETMVA